MTRERYKTPDEEISAEFTRVCQLFQQALPGPSDRILFECLMNEASSRGLNWVDGLQYVVEQRQRLELAEPATEKQDASAGTAAPGTRDEPSS